MKHILLSFAALMSAAALCARNIDIIPRPESLVPGKGQFRITAQTTIGALPELRRPAEVFAADIEPVVGYRLPVAEKGALFLAVNDALQPEEYTLAVTPKGIRIGGGSPQAVFHALQTLRQLVAPDGTVPAVEIADKPCFAHRGGMLDSGRHFWTVDEVKRFIDILAMHKLNRFHWHLSEDQGWRIEIKRYPLLTQIGSIRKETVIGRYDKTDESRNRYDGTPYGGFYTQDDIRDIVAYAAERYIEVIPEIDMPGHMLGALAAYPALGCRGEGYEVGPIGEYPKTCSARGKRRPSNSWRTFSKRFSGSSPRSSYTSGATNVPRIAGKSVRPARNASVKRGSQTRTSCKAISCTASKSGFTSTAANSSDGTKSCPEGFRNRPLSWHGPTSSGAPRPRKRETA